MAWSVRSAVRAGWVGLSLLGSCSPEQASTPEASDRTGSGRTLEDPTCAGPFALDAVAFVACEGTCNNLSNHFVVRPQLGSDFSAVVTHHLAVFLTGSDLPPTE